MEYSSICVYTQVIRVVGLSSGTPLAPPPAENEATYIYIHIYIHIYIVIHVLGLSSGTPLPPPPAEDEVYICIMYCVISSL